MNLPDSSHFPLAKDGIEFAPQKRLVFPLWTRT